MSDDNEMQLGGKLGPRMAKLIADALVFTRQRLGPHQAGIAQLVLQDFTNHVSDEMRGVMGPIWTQFAESPDTPTELKPLFNALANERGQAWAWIAGSATGAATSATLGDLFSNYLAPVTHALIGTFPNGLLSPETVAQSFASRLQEIVGEIDLIREHKSGGLSSERMRYLVELAHKYPSTPELVEMLNRRIITPSIYAATVKRLGFKEEWIDRLQALSHQEFTLPELVALWNRSAITDREAQDAGQKQGYNEDQIRKALELGGEPLSPQELGEAFRRGFIDETRFNRGIVQGPIRNEWFDVLERLQFSRMSTVDAADAVNQGHITLEQGARVAHDNGLDPNDFKVLIETAGAPPGIDFATEALNRKFIDETEFKRMFLESRIKNRYLPLLLQMRTRLIPQETARLAYREGVYSKEDALRTLLAHGFTPDDAATLLAIEDKRQDETTKELTRAQVVQMYDEQILDADTTKGLLKDLGYSAENIDLMIALADVQRVQRFINSAITRIRSAYLTGKIDENEASLQLDALQVPSGQRDELIAIWGIDRSTVSKTLTAAQIRQAVAKKLITREDAMGRLVAQGYDQIDADLFLQLTA